ncbi:hypothetical protein [Demequina muriae]|uniref:Leucine rich repeat variant n=1 Tax=Demequina muriae TaxID=3051664 RepID=A0ABT8GHF4_9MICO|nr:hypothetical protein [Demequina sp. EGI L300058]MDN4480855.1 hypothetical protein [Demequina sp. EGI L300058]
MSHGSRDDGSWSRALMAASGIGGVRDATSREGSPAWHEASGADLAGPRFLELAHHRDPAVREALARRPDCPMGVLASLAHDARPAVRAAAASNGRARAAILDNLARDRDPGVLKAVARNPATPRETLLRLCGHRRQEVRRVALRALTDPERPPVSEGVATGDVPLELRDGAEPRPPSARPGLSRHRAPTFYAPKPVVQSSPPATSPDRGVDGPAAPHPPAVQ